MTTVAGMPKEVAPEDGEKREITDREIEAYIQDQADWSALKGNRVRSSGERGGCADVPQDL